MPPGAIARSLTASRDIEFRIVKPAACAAADVQFPLFAPLQNALLVS